MSALGDPDPELVERKRVSMSGNMNQEYYEQAKRLQELRTAQLQRQQQDQSSISRYASSASTNDWRPNEQNRNGYPNPRGAAATAAPASPGNEVLRDPLIFPGVYAPSGYNIMDILVAVHTRPNPTITIGNIDHSVALTLCDTSLPDIPIVYCSEMFEVLSGYSSREIIGQNCRFLQYPPSGQAVSEEDTAMNDKSRTVLKQKISAGEEARVEFVNFTKAGRRFLNVLTTVPVTLDGVGEEGGRRRYIVGFQADAQRAFAG